MGVLPFQKESEYFEVLERSEKYKSDAESTEKRDSTLQIAEGCKYDDNLRFIR